MTFATRPAAQASGKLALFSWQIRLPDGDLAIPSERGLRLLLGLDRQIQAKSGDLAIPSERGLRLLLPPDRQIQAKSGDLAIPSERFWIY